MQQPGAYSVNPSLNRVRGRKEPRMDTRIIGGVPAKGLE